MAGPTTACGPALGGPTVLSAAALCLTSISSGSTFHVDRYIFLAAIGVAPVLAGAAISGPALGFWFVVAHSTSIGIRDQFIECGHAIQAQRPGGAFSPDLDVLAGRFGEWLRGVEIEGRGERREVLQDAVAAVLVRRMRVAGDDQAGVFIGVVASPDRGV